MDRSTQKELLEYQRTLHWLDANRLRLMQEAYWINDKCPSVWCVNQQDGLFKKIYGNTLQLLDYAHTLI
jgi:hypothetical protein